MNSRKELNFLAINTAGKNVEVVLCYQNKCTLICEEGQRKAGETLVALIDNALREQNAPIESLDFIAACIGPGSFTGIRIGIVTARSLCQALKIKLLPLTYPEILSYNIQSGQKDIYTFSDAGNSFIYAAKLNSDHELIGAPACIVKSDIEKLLSENDCAIVAESDSIIENGNAVIHKGAQGLQKAAYEKYLKSGAIDYNLAEPLYIRQPQAVTDLSKESKAL